MSRPDARAVAAGAALASAAGVTAWALLVEPGRIVVRRRELHLPRWPRIWDGFRLAMVSDLHAGAPHAGLDKVEQVVEQIDELGADLIALVGDYVDPTVAFADPVSPEAVAARLGRLRAPLGVFAVLGNHDWLEDGVRVASALRDNGIRVLENDAVRLRRTPAELWVAGLADATERRPDPVRTLDGVPDDGATLLLSHDPDVFPRVPPKVALTVSGHTHGGQLNIPGLRAKVIPSRFGDRYAAGHIVEDGRHLFVSRGVGTSKLPLRLGAAPEVVLLTLRPG